MSKPRKHIKIPDTKKAREFFSRDADCLLAYYGLAIRADNGVVKNVDIDDHDDSLEIMDKNGVIKIKTCDSHKTCCGEHHITLPLSHKQPKQPNAIQVYREPTPPTEESPNQDKLAYCFYLAIEDKYYNPYESPKIPQCKAIIEKAKGNLAEVQRRFDNLQQHADCDTFFKLLPGELLGKWDRVNEPPKIIDKRAVLADQRRASNEELIRNHNTKEQITKWLTMPKNPPLQS